MSYVDISPLAAIPTIKCSQIVVNDRDVYWQESGDTVYIMIQGDYTIVVMYRDTMCRAIYCDFKT